MNPEVLQRILLGERAELDRAIAKLEGLLKCRHKFLAAEEQTEETRRVHHSRPCVHKSGQC